MSPKMGRPKVDSPLRNDVKVRLDDALHEELLKYCSEHDRTKAEVIREAIVNYLNSAK